MTIDAWLILHQQQLIGDNIKWRLPLNIQAAIWRVLRNILAVQKSQQMTNKGLYSV